MANKYGVGVAQLGVKAIDKTVMKGATVSYLGNKVSITSNKSKHQKVYKTQVSLQCK